GALETPTAPMASFPTLIGTPPPTAITFGICFRKAFSGLSVRFLNSSGVWPRVRAISLEAAKFHGVRIGPVAADGRSDIASLINDHNGNLIAIFCTLLERALNDHERHFHRNVPLDLRSLRTGRRGERE